MAAVCALAAPQNVQNLPLAHIEHPEVTVQAQLDAADRLSLFIRLLQ